MTMPLAQYCSLTPEQAAACLVGVQLRVKLAAAAKQAGAAEVLGSLKGYGTQGLEAAKGYGTQLWNAAPGSGDEYARNALIGAGTGGLLGLGQSLSRPRGKRRPLSTILSGAAMGGLVGAGGTAAGRGIENAFLKTPPSELAADAAAAKELAARAKGVHSGGGILADLRKATSGTGGAIGQGLSAVSGLDPAPNLFPLQAKDIMAESPGSEQASRVIGGAAGAGLGSYAGGRISDRAAGQLQSHTGSLQRLYEQGKPPATGTPARRVYNTLQTTHAATGATPPPIPRHVPDVAAAARRYGVSEADMHAALRSEGVRPPPTMRGRLGRLGAKGIGAGFGGFLGTHAPEISSALGLPAIARGLMGADQ